MNDEIENYFEELSDEEYNHLIEHYNLDIKQLEKDMENYVPKIDVAYRVNCQEATYPTYNYDSDSGFDLYSTEEYTIEPFGRVLVSTGLHIDIPENHEIQVRSKSGLALKDGLMVLNSPGTVDQGYLGEIKVIMFNTSNKTVIIEKKQKVAQAVLCPVVCGKWVNLVQKDELSSKDRNDNGFGSTGIK